MDLPKIQSALMEVKQQLLQHLQDKATVDDLIMLCKWLERRAKREEDHKKKAALNYVKKRSWGRPAEKQRPVEKKFVEKKPVEKKRPPSKKKEMAVKTAIIRVMGDRTMKLVEILDAIQNEGLDFSYQYIASSLSSNTPKTFERVSRGVYRVKRTNAPSKEAAQPYLPLQLGEEEGENKVIARLPLDATELLAGTEFGENT
jgi:hypothetical protein